ncbi:MAG: Trk system potassium transporter TrkA [Synergistaceae bacterium]|nr:Trk system potassium transporter TrkA [Synergistaceae bacterium]
MRIVLVGAGEVGYSVAKNLSEDGHDIVVVEEDKDKAERIDADLNVQAIRGNGASPSVLAQAGITDNGDRAQMLIACTNTDEVNLMACLIAKQMGVKHVIARTKGLEFTDTDSWARSLGIDLMISTERSVAKEIETLLEIRGASRATELARGKAGVYLFKVNEGSKACGITLAELRQQNSDLNTIIICIKRGKESFVPRAFDKLQQGDLCYTICYRNQIGKIEDIFNIEHKKVLKTVIINGGSNLGRQIAKRIHTRWPNLAIKIFDPDKTKCSKIETEVPYALPINADGSDANLLDAEGIRNNAAVISVTERDESNLMLSVLGKTLGALKAISVVQKTNYLDMIDHLPLDAIVNRNQALADGIIRSVRFPGSSRMLMVFNEIDAEAVEVCIEEDSPAADKTLQQLNMPSGSVIGLIERGDELLIPSGSSEIKAADKVYLFASSEIMPEAIQHLGVNPQ